MIYFIFAVIVLFALILGTIMGFAIAYYSADSTIKDMERTKMLSEIINTLRDEEFQEHVINDDLPFGYEAFMDYIADELESIFGEKK